MLCGCLVFSSSCDCDVEMDGTTGQRNSVWDTLMRVFHALSILSTPEKCVALINLTVSGDPVQSWKCIQK